MRKFLPYISLVTVAIIVLAVFAMPHTALAADSNSQDCALLDVVCHLFGGVNFFYGWVSKIFWWGLIPVASFLFKLLGNVIDIALEISMMHDFYNAQAVSLAWSVIRDIANMLFIFILIYEGIRTVLNLGNLVSVRKTLTSVIIAALFLNFSLFFTKAIIDVSNVGATWFMQGITKIGNNESVSFSIGSVLGMEKVSARYKNTVKDLSDIGLDMLATGFFLLILLCVAIYVFFNVLFLIVGRIVSFMFLLITSPIGFVGPLVPILQDYSKKWWKELWDQAMMLPMFFLMVYLTLFIVDRVQGLLATTIIDDPATFNPANYVIFIIIIMMLLKALEVAKEYSGELGNKFGDLAKSATTFVGGTALVGMVGGAGRAMASNKMFQDMAVNGGVMGKVLGKTVLQTGTFVAKQGFGAGGAYKSLLKQTGTDDVGLMKDSWKGLDKGNIGRREQALKDEQEYAKLLGKGEEGAMRRQQYAENQKNSLWAIVSRQSTAAKKLGEDATKEVIKERGESGKRLKETERADIEKLQIIEDKIAGRIGTGADALKQEISALEQQLGRFDDANMTVGGIALGSKGYQTAKENTTNSLAAKKKQLEDMRNSAASDLMKEKAEIEKDLADTKAKLSKRKDVDEDIRQAKELEAEENQKILKDVIDKEKKGGGKSDESPKPPKEDGAKEK